MLVSQQSYRLLPTSTGVYTFLDKNGKVIYVGKALNLKNRVSSYFAKNLTGEKTKTLVSKIDKIRVIEVGSQIEAFLLEEKLIKKFLPKYNIRLVDGKTYLSVKITVSDKYPKILLTRRYDDPKSLYFGPYTSAGSLKSVLKIVRKIFPYQAVLNHPNKLCLYNHLNLCPCPTVTHDITYKRNIKHIIDFLNGDTKKVLKDLEKDRDEYAKKEQFEEASKIQTKIDAINLVTSPFYKPFEYEINPNFKSDVLKNQLTELINILNSNGYKISDLDRIECYDISNLSGKNSTGSMVVFTNGEKHSSQYRRFKIKGDFNGKPNDFGMLSEMIKRRFTHKEWESPSLVVIDGGKGQVSAVKKTLSELNSNINIIGLAKRDEIIITRDLNEILLPKDSKSLQLVMRIRDEAHRFAITYHKKLRSKFIFS